MDRSDPEQARRARQALDVLMYAVVWVATLVAVSAVVSFPLGGGWVGVKYVLFFVGFFLFGLSALRLRPTPPWKRDDSEMTSGEREETRFQAFVQRLPPLGRYGLAPDERLSAATKLFIVSVLSLVLSYLLETVFGIKA
jgi:hypothetical protein